MERKTLKQFHHELSQSTRIYTLATLLTIIGSFVFDAWSTNWAMTIISVLAVILFVESFAISFIRHPERYRALRWIILLILLALLLISNAP